MFGNTKPAILSQHLNKTIQRRLVVKSRTIPSTNHTMWKTLERLRDFIKLIFSGDLWVRLFTSAYRPEIEDHEEQQGCNCHCSEREYRWDIHRYYSSGMFLHSCPPRKGPTSRHRYLSALAGQGLQQQELQAAQRGNARQIVSSTKKCTSCNSSSRAGTW